MTRRRSGGKMDDCNARGALVGAAWALCIEAVVAGLVVLIVKVV